MLHIEIPEADVPLLRDVFAEKLKDLRREESHTDSPRYRAGLYQVDVALERLLAQLPGDGSDLTTVIGTA